MKALFVGLGSIGQRHLRNFRKILGEEAEVLAYRTTKHRLVIENGEGVPCESLASRLRYREFNDLTEALAEQPKIVFITNPSAHHLEIAHAAAAAGCDLFIEKPLSDSLIGVDELASRVQEKNSW